jgi:hypothetical protein
MYGSLVKSRDGSVGIAIGYGSDSHNSAPQEVARCAVNIIKVYFENEKKPIYIETYYIHGFYS